MFAESVGREGESAEVFVVAFRCQCRRQPTNAGKRRAQRQIVCASRGGNAKAKVRRLVARSRLSTHTTMHPFTGFRRVR